MGIRKTIIKAVRGSRRCSWALTAVLTFILQQIILKPADAQVPLRVLGTGATARNELVTFGFPLDQSSGILSTSGLAVTDNGVAIPAQFQVLTRWNAAPTDTTQPIRWMLASFVANVPAIGSGQAQATKDYTLSLSGVANPVGPLSYSETSNSVTVQNGTAQFVVPKLNANLFSSVQLGGVEMISGSAGLDIRDISNLSATISINSTTVLAPDSGSLKVIVHKDFSVTSLAGVIGSLDYTFSPGSAVQLELTLTNTASANVLASRRYISSASLNLPLSLTNQVVTTPNISVSNPNSTFAIDQTFTPPPGGQDPNLDLLDNFSFTEKNGSTTVVTGTRSHGVIDLSDAGGKGASLGVERFWQRYGKQLSVTGNTIKAELMNGLGTISPHNGQYGLIVPSCTSGAPGVQPDCDPQTEISNYLSGGKQVSWTVKINFHSTTPSASGLAQFSDELNTPLMGLRHGMTDLTPYVDEPVPMAHPDSSDPGVARYERFNLALVYDSVTDNVPNIGKVGLQKFLQRGGTYGQQWYDFGDNFGNIPWADGISNLHYAWDKVILQNFWRFGDYQFFNRGRDMLRNKRDNGQNHASTTQYWRGASFYEKGLWNGNYIDGDDAHSWGKGLLYHWLMTGDRRSYQSFIDLVEFTKRQSAGAWGCQWGDRTLAQRLAALVDGYIVTHSSVYLNNAANEANDYQNCEIASGMHGFVLNTGANPPNVKPWMTAQAFQALIRYAQISGDTSHDLLLQRMKDYFVNGAMIPGSGTPTSYTLEQTYYCHIPSYSGGVWSSGQCPGEAYLSWHHVNSVAWGLAFYARYVGDTSLRSYVRTLWDHYIKYWQYSPGATVNLTTSTGYSLLTNKPSMYPGSESKVLGNLYDWGMSSFWSALEELGGATGPAPEVTPIPGVIVTPPPVVLYPTPGPSPAPTGTPVPPTATPGGGVQNGGGITPGVPTATPTAAPGESNAAPQVSLRKSNTKILAASNGRKVVRVKVTVRDTDDRVVSIAGSVLEKAKTIGQASKSITGTSSINGTFELVMKPRKWKVGKHTIRVVVTDGHGAVTTKTLKL